MHIGSIFPISSLLIRIIRIHTARESRHTASSADPDCPRKNEKAKKFWSFVKSLKKDAFGINLLRENGILKSDTLDKANICNRQFESAFTRESDTETLQKALAHSPPLAKSQLTLKGS